MLLVHDLTLLEVGCNFDRLYGGSDPDYELCLRVVRDRVNNTHHERQERERAQAKAAGG